MGKNLICDTNVFYGLAEGRLKYAQIRASGETLFWSPLSALELAAKWSIESHINRQGAAKSILESNAQELPDCDSLLTRLFGYKPRRAGVSMEQAIRAMATSSSMEELLSGVASPDESVVRRLNITVATQWRELTAATWVRDIVEIMFGEVPGFSDWWNSDPKLRKGRVPRLKGAGKQHFIADSKRAEFRGALLSGLQVRALECADTASIAFTKEAASELFAGSVRAACYCAIYTEYLIRVLTEEALPQENDRVDIELFLYAWDDDNVVVTGERKWKRLAERAGFGSRVRLVM